MNSKNHDLTEFEDLITELENPEVRPYAPNLPRETKEEMRRTLFTTQEGGLSRQAAMNLWKFAGTAVAAFLLMFIVASFIAAISNPSTQTGPQENVVSPPQRTPHAPTPDDASAEVAATESPDLLDRTITFDDRVQVTGYELQSETEGIKLRLQWTPLDIVDDRIHLFIHFIRENGEIVLQADGPLTEDMTLLSSEPEEVFEGNLFVPTSDLSNGRFNIIIGLYNTETGERLPVSANDEMLVTDGGTAVQIGSWSTDDLQDRIWLISVSPAPGTNLYDTDGVPTTFTFEIGYELVSAESAYLDWSLQPVGEGELPRYVEYSATADIEAQHRISQGMGSKVVEMTMTSTRVDGLAEAVAAHILLSLPDKRITLPPDTLEELVWPLTPEENDEVWQQDANVLPLTVAADNIFGLTLHQLPDGDPYDLTLDENVTFTLANSDNDNLVEADNTIWISFEVTNAATGEDYRAWVPLSIYNRIKMFGLAFKTQKPEWRESGSVWLVSVTQKERPSVDSPIELEITLGYEFISDSGEDVFIKIHYADPGWESKPATGGRLPIDGLGIESRYFLDKNRGEVTFNATLHPNEAMQIVGNENPVLVAQLGYIGSLLEGRVLHLLANVTFSQYPLDLTTTEEIQYSP